MMSDDILYDWDTDGRLDDWKLEGPGELIKDPNGALQIRTYNNGPLWRASTAWLRNLELPPDYEVTWTYRNGSETDARITTEGVMILFNALPLALKNLFEDPRLSGRYSDICSYGKMVCIRAASIARCTARPVNSVNLVGMFQLRGANPTG